MNHRTNPNLLAALLGVVFTAEVHAQSTAFTYQGRLETDGTAYTGLAEMQFSLWSADSGGSQLGSTLTVGAINVANGLFTVPLDFGDQFPGADRWLEIAVRTNLLGFTTLSPRQPLTATPYAITAENLSGVLPSGQLSGTVPGANLGGTYPGAVTFDNAANNFIGSFVGTHSGDGSGLADVDAATIGGLAPASFWQLGGNTGTSPGAHFIGTTDAQPLEFKVNGERGWRLAPTLTTEARSNIVNVVAGSSVNVVGPGVYGATIGGGGGGRIGGSPGTNRVDADFGTISGGYRNQIGTDSSSATIAGGVDNDVGTNSNWSAIGGGRGNGIADNSILPTIGGGGNNKIGSGSGVSTIAGGSFNNIGIGSIRSTIGGGSGNSVADDSDESTIAGGGLNDIGNSSENSAIGGGFQNNIADDAPYATIPGGFLNNVGANAANAFAAGNRANANHTGAFVWADSQNTDFVSTADDQFNVRASGGARIVGSGGFDNPQLRLQQTDTAGIARFRMGVSGSPDWDMAVTSGSTPELRFFTAGANRLTVQSDGDVFATSFNPTSDRAAKENFRPVDPQAVLSKVAALPLATWNYKADSETRHLGPVAQDFHAAFGVGPDDKHIATVDADGVALAAIQGLNQKVEQKDAEIAELKEQGETLHRMNAELVRRLEALEQRLR